MIPEPSYFTCTLGQAAVIRATSSTPTHSSIPELLAHKAQTSPEKSAIGFIKPSSSANEWTTKVLTFKQIHDGVRATAAALHGLLPKYASEEQRLEGHGKTQFEHNKTVALISPSSTGFLFTWLGLIELGYAVLLIAPQCRPAAIAHLCKECGADILIYDVLYENLAGEVVEAPHGQHEKERKEGGRKRLLLTAAMPFSTDKHVFEFIEKNKDSLHGEWVDMNRASEESVAYIHHTSGTSSGLPKPIPQTHRAAIGVLPQIPSSSMKATFTTTPLYHGGIADLFRAWTSDALIWLFPGRDIPITANTIVNSLQAIDRCAHGREGDLSLRTAYFSSVPYVLQLLESDESGLRYLQQMDLVGVGGAALPVEIGDWLVEKGVRLLTRFGSAECGFLLSSHRDYTTDREWQYHRLPSEVRTLEFEHRAEDGTCELIVLPGWPHMAKRNRGDGSFATSDLFEAHANLQSAWKYHSRADSQLTLSTGKKFDPAPLEDAISASLSTMVEGALIFGNVRPYPGILLFRSSASTHLADKEFLKSCRPIIERLNAESQSHARIKDDMLIPMPHHGDGQALEKSSKGTVLRGSAEKKYREVIEKAYNAMEEEIADMKDDDIITFISSTIRSILKREDIKNYDDLFHAGLDSIASMQIRQQVLKLIPKENRKLPLTVVEDCGTINGLCDYVLSLRHSSHYSISQDDVELMHKLVDKYGTFDFRNDTKGFSQEFNSKYKGQVIVLTGATGALGSNILQKLRGEKWVAKVYCLVRGASRTAAEERVNKALEQRGFHPLSAEGEDRHIIVLRSTLGHSMLGLEDELYEQLVREATIFMHLAWAVNFRMRLRNFEKDHIVGLHNLLSAAMQSTHLHPPSFIFCSSVASVINSRFAKGIPEHFINDTSAASPIGYSRSKWVAEQICNRAHGNNLTRLRGRIAVLRVGQLSGDTVHGIWNTQEAWPMMLSSMRATRVLPKLRREPLSWLPVDIAADAFLDAALALSESERGRKEKEKGVDEMPVYHIINEHKTPEWMDLLKWLKRVEDFEIVDVQEWLKRLEGLERSGVDHPSLKLLGHWKDSYGKAEHGNEVVADKGGKEAGGVEEARFRMEVTKRDLPALRNVKEVDEGYFRKLWKHVKNS